MREIFTLEHFDGGRKLHAKRPDFLHHRRGVALSLFQSFGLFASRHASDKPIHIPDEIPNFFFGRANFYFFLKFQGFCSKGDLFLLSEVFETGK